LRGPALAPAPATVAAPEPAPALTDAVLAAMQRDTGALDLGVVPLEGEPTAEPGEPGAFADLVIPDAEAVSTAIARARDAVPGSGPGGADKWRHIPEDRSGDPRASVSVGNATTGVLVNGKALAPAGRGYRVRTPTLTRAFHHGTDGLVSALQRAAAEVERAYAGSVLLVGNMSRELGGDIPPSVSHNSGRDVDLGFFVCDELGRPLGPPGDDYVTFDADGVSEGRAPQLYFDSARNWELVRALLTDPAVQVQYVFVAEWLEALLLDYAIRTGVDPDLVVRADQVMQQPHNSSPHAEHFHVRLYCDLADRLSGCHDEGPQWAWIQRFDDVVQARIEALVDLYQTGDPAKRDYVRRQLDLLTVVPESQLEAGEDPGAL
jgi:penicillin-insensitive murein endopeptidase